MSPPPVEKPNRRGSLNAQAVQLSRNPSVNRRLGFGLGAGHGCPVGAREEPSPGTVATRGGAPRGPPHLPNVGSLGWRVGTARGGGHQQEQEGQGQEEQGQEEQEQEEQGQEQEEQEQEEQEQQHRLPAGCAAPDHAGALPGAGLGALADILAVK